MTVQAQGKTGLIMIQFWILMILVIRTVHLHKQIKSIRSLSCPFSKRKFSYFVIKLSQLYFN